jgi:hypothetical protein
MWSSEIRLLANAYGGSLDSLEDDRYEVKVVRLSVFRCLLATIRLPASK